MSPWQTSPQAQQTFAHLLGRGGPLSSSLTPHLSTRHRLILGILAQTLYTSCLLLPRLSLRLLTRHSASPASSQSLKIPSQIPALPFNRQLTWTNLLNLPGIICKIGKTIQANSKHQMTEYRQTEYRSTTASCCLFYCPLASSLTGNCADGLHHPKHLLPPVRDGEPLPEVRFPSGFLVFPLRHWWLGHCRGFSAVHKARH